MKKTTFFLLLSFWFFDGFSQNGLFQYPFLSQFSIPDRRGNSGLAVDDSGRVWMSFNGFKMSGKFVPSSIGLLTFGSDSVWKKIRLDSLGGPSTTYLTSLQFFNGALWMGSDKGLIKKQGNSWKVFNQNGQQPDTVNNFKLAGNRIYLATQNGIKVFYDLGFFSYWVNYDTLNSNLPTNQIKAIDIAADGSLWLATNLGVVHFNPQQNQSELFNKDNSDFFSNEILSIKVLPNGDVWAGTAAGLTKYYATGLFFYEEGRFKHLTNRFDFKVIDFVPRTGFSNIVNNGNKIVFPVYTEKNNKGYFLWFELEGKKVSHYFLQKPDGLYNNFSGLCRQGEDYYFSMPATLPTFKLTLSNLVQDSSYFYELFALDTSTDYHTKEIPSVLDINNLHAPLMVRGDLFFLSKNGVTNLSVRSNAQKQISYTAGLWMGGLSDGNLHIAAGTYRQSGIDYGQGPLKIGSASTTPETRLKFGRMWKVEERDIEDFRNNFNKPGYTIPEPILSWPAHGDSANGYEKNLAPFVDINGNGMYEPKAGDYPKIKGQQNVFWIFNDSIKIHSESEGVPLGIEVQCNAYAYVCNQINDADVDKAINNSLFLHYKIINRSNRTYTNFTTGFFSDNALGDFNNDRVGSNPKESYSFWYNGDTIDAGLEGFGKQLPACAIVMLKGFKGDDGVVKPAQKMVSYNNDFSQYGNPSRPEHYYNYLQGRWKDGSPITYGGLGYKGTDSQQVWMYPGSNDLLSRPPWTEENSGAKKGDKRHLLIPENITLEPGEVQELEFALVYTPTQHNQKELVLQQLHLDVLKIKNWYKQNSFPSCSNVPLGLSPKTDSDSQFDLLVYPNPSSGSISFNCSSRIEKVQVFDMKRKVLINLQEENITVLEIATLEPGIYILQVYSKDGVKSKKFIKE